MNLAVLADAARRPTAAPCTTGGTWLTWGEVRRRAAAVAAGLAGLGVRPGDRVAIVWPTSVDFVVAYLGVLAAGAVAVPLNPNSPAGRAGARARRRRAGGRAGRRTAGRRRRRPVVVPATGRRAPTARGLGGVSVGPTGEPDGRRRARPASTGAGAAATGGRAGPTVRPVLHRDESDLAVLLFTSGTAGEPKAAMLTHGNLMANLRQMLAIPEILRADDVGLVAPCRCSMCSG